MGEERAESVTWKGVKFYKVPQEEPSLLRCTVYIAENSSLIKRTDNKIEVPTEAEIAERTGIRDYSSGFYQIKKICQSLKLPVPSFTVVLVPDINFRNVTNTPKWASATIRSFPDNSANYVYILKENYGPLRSLLNLRLRSHDDSAWNVEMIYNILVHIEHEALHNIPVFHPSHSSKAIAEGLCELVPKMLIGHERFMCKNSAFLLGLDKNGSIENRTKLHRLTDMYSGSRWNLYQSGHDQNQYPTQSNPLYGSAYLFMVGYFLELQKKLVAQDKKYEDNMLVLKYLIDGLSGVKNRNEVIPKLAEMLNTSILDPDEKPITPEFLYESYDFQKKGREWVEEQLKQLEKLKYAARERERRKNTAEHKNGIA